MIPSSRVDHMLAAIRRRSFPKWVAMVVLSGMSVQIGCASLRGDHDCAGSCATATCLDTSVAVDPVKASLVQTHRCVDELPCEAVPSPPGTYVGAWGQAMAHQAAVQGEIISRNLWFAGGQQLGPDGQERMVAIAESFAAHPRLILIEEEPVAIGANQSYNAALQDNAALNAERKAAVIEALSRLGIPDAADFVYFTSDRSVGIRGIEAPNIFNRQFTGGIGAQGLGGGITGGIGAQGIGGGIGGGLGGGMIGGGMGGIGGGGFGGGGIF